MAESGAFRLEKNVVIVYLFRGLLAILAWLALQDHNRVTSIEEAQAKDANRITVQETLSPVLKERLDHIDEKLDNLLARGSQR